PASAHPPIRHHRPCTSRRRTDRSSAAPRRHSCLAFLPAAADADYEPPSRLQFVTGPTHSVVVALPSTRKSAISTRRRVVVPAGRAAPATPDIPGTIGADASPRRGWYLPQAGRPVSAVVASFGRSVRTGQEPRPGVGVWNCANLREPRRL